MWLLGVVEGGVDVRQSSEKEGIEDRAEGIYKIEDTAP